MPEKIADTSVSKQTTCFGVMFFHLLHHLLISLFFCSAREIQNAIYINTTGFSFFLAITEKNNTSCGRQLFRYASSEVKLICVHYSQLFFFVCIFLHTLEKKKKRKETKKQMKDSIEFFRQPLIKKGISFFAFGQSTSTKSPIEDTVYQLFQVLED